MVTTVDDELLAGDERARGVGCEQERGADELAGLAEVAEARLGIPARVARPGGYGGLSDLIGTPSFATSIGLVEYALKGRERVAEPAGMQMPSLKFEAPAGGFFRRIASIGRALMPQ